MMLPEICIKRPVLATVLSLIVVLVGLISYTRLSVREYPRIDEPVVSVSVTYRGASAEVVESQVTKPLEDSLAGIEGVEVMTSQSRSETLADQRPLHAEARSGLGRRGRARQGGAGARQAARHDRRADHRQGRGRLQPDHLHRGAGGVAHDARGFRLRQALRAAAALGAAGRRGRAHLRRAPGVDAHQSRPHAAGRLQADGAGRRGRDPQAERRNPGGPHRVDGARVHRRGRDRYPHARAVQQHHRRQRRRLSGAHPRCRFGGDRPGRRARDLALQRQVLAQHRRHQAGGRESAGAVERREGGGREDQSGAADRA